MAFHPRKTLIPYQASNNGFRDDGAWDVKRRRFRFAEVIRAWAIVIVPERGKPIEGLQAGVRELRSCLVDRGSLHTGLQLGQCR